MRFLVRANGSDFRQNCTSQLDLEIIWVDLEIIPKDLKHFAKRTSTHFIDFGGVEQGPYARNGCSEQYFRISTFLQFLSSLVPGHPKEEGWLDY